MLEVSATILPLLTLISNNNNNLLECISHIKQNKGTYLGASEIIIDLQEHLLFAFILIENTMLHKKILQRKMRYSSSFPYFVSQYFSCIS